MCYAQDICDMLRTCVVMVRGHVRYTDAQDICDMLRTHCDLPWHVIYHGHEWIERRSVK